MQRRFMERRMNSTRNVQRSTVRKLSDATDTNPMIEEDEDEYGSVNLQRYRC